MAQTRARRAPELTSPRQPSKASRTVLDGGAAWGNGTAIHLSVIRDTLSAVIASVVVTCLLCSCANEPGLLKKERYMQSTDPHKRLSATFSTHNFGPYCFDTLECRIEYDGRVWLDEKSRSAPIDDRQRANLTGSIVGINNFPGPVSITWRSLDGRGHKANIDFAEIFSDEHIVHSRDLDVRDVPKDAAFVEPEIIVVVNDLTVSVYMKAFIPLMHPKKGDAAESNHRYEPVLAWTQNF